MAHITVPTEETLIRYTAATGVGPFVFDWSWQEDDDISVSLGGVVLATNLYSVSAASFDGEGGFRGGSVTLASSAGGADLVIYRDTVPERASDFNVNGPMVDQLNTELDRMTMVDQDLRQWIGSIPRVLTPNSILLSNEDGSAFEMTDLGVPVDRAGNALGFGTNGEITLLSADNFVTLSLQVTNLEAAAFTVESLQDIGDPSGIRFVDGQPWVYKTEDLTDYVAAAPLIFLPPNADPTGASGAWVPVVDGNVIDGNLVNFANDAATTVPGYADATDHTPLVHQLFEFAQFLQTRGAASVYIDFPGGHHSFLTPLDPFPEGVFPTSRDGGRCDLQCGYDLPDRYYEEDSTTDPVVFPFGTDTVPEASLEVEVRDVESGSPTFNIYRWRTLDPSEYTVSQTATETTITPVSAWPAPEGATNNLPRNVRVSDYLRRSFMRFDSQRGGSADGIILERGPGYDTGVAFAITASDADSLNTGDDTLWSFEVTGYGTWTDCAELDGTRKMVGAQGVRDVQFGPMVLFQCWRQNLTCRTVRSANFDYVKASNNGSPQTNFVFTGNYLLNGETSNVTGFFVGDSLLFDHVTGVNIHCATTDRVDATGETTNVQVTTSDKPVVRSNSLFVRVMDRDGPWQFGNQFTHQTVSGFSVVQEYVRDGVLLGYDGAASSSNGDYFAVSTAAKIQLIAATNVNLTAGTGVFIANSSAFYPNVANTLDLGRASQPFKDIYTQNAVTVTSDARTKDIIGHPLEVLGRDACFKFERLADEAAIAYRQKDGGQRTHIGYSAQAIRDAVIAVGWSTDDMAFFIKSPWMDLVPKLDDDGNPDYTVITRMVGNVEEIVDWHLETEMVPRIDPETDEPMEKMQLRYQELETLLSSIRRAKRAGFEERIDARIEALEAASQS